MEIKGTKNTAKAFASIIEDEAIEQIEELCSQEFVKDSKIRIMPDVHKGKGCTIGFTMTITDYVCPNLVGVDIGCGMRTVMIGKQGVDLEKLDNIIHAKIPSGKSAHEGRLVKYPRLQELKCYRNLKNTRRLEASIGTLGGGNHFIEVDMDEDDNKYLVIHSGSRNLGHQVATYYQELAVEICSGKDKMYDEINEMIKEYKETGRRKEIQSEYARIKKRYDGLFPPLPNDLCYLTGNYKDDYLHDMAICQEYAELNRKTMAEIIINEYGLVEPEDGYSFETVHNYINFEDNILRKGAISARKDEKVLIPINMRDGCILGVGKGNEDWNYSAPHGAGRTMSRMKAKETFTMDEFEKSMEGVFTTSVCNETLDEAPMAYKPIESILNNICDTVEVLKLLKPVYNFKASE